MFGLDAGSASRCSLQSYQPGDRIHKVATTKPDLDIVQELVTEFGENASYVAELLARYRVNPASLDEEWRAFFRERTSAMVATASIR